VLWSLIGAQWIDGDPVFPAKSAWELG